MKFQFQPVDYNSLWVLRTVCPNFVLLRLFCTSVIKYYIIVHFFSYHFFPFCYFLLKIKRLRFYGEFRVQNIISFLLFINLFTFAQNPYMVLFRPADGHYAVTTKPFISWVTQNGMISSEILI